MDEKRLRQVLLNLLGNAVKFTDRGEVSLALSRAASGKIRFLVEDTGIGIREDKIDQLFQPFTQVSDAARNTEGTGLGLALSQRLVGLMGGVIEVQSQLGHGSRFSFEIDLPAAEAPLSTIERAPLPEIIGYHGPRRRLLAVDDLRDNRAVIQHLLTPLGFEIMQAENGEEGFKKALEWKPDLIMTDLVMPVMDGFTFTRKLRAHPDLKHSPIIAVSASVFDYDTAKSREVGCDDFIQKPVALDHLLDKLGRHLKLEWVYQELPEGSQPAAGPPPSAPVPTAPASGTGTPVPLPPDQARRLRALAAKGDITGAAALARELAEAEPRYGAFAAQIANLAERFKVKLIRQLIDDHTPTEAAIHQDSAGA
ncbi:MAG: ATP-binding protein [Gammaproteobacteria bacterium]